MTTKVLYLYVDTNLFIQCRPLNQLDWSIWSEFETVNLIVSRPVHREIDHQKYRGNDRVAKRARSTYSLFRKIITIGNSQGIVQTEQPRVELILETPSIPDPDLKSELDYSIPDDNIIGCMSTFMKSKPDADVRLLTNDAGPMMTAQSIGLPFELMPQDWLIEPENNTYEREIARLNKEISTLKKQEPSVEIECFELADDKISVIELECSYFEPLGETVIKSMMDSIKSRFPMVTAFDTERKPTNTAHLGLGLSSMNQSYSPPTKEAINTYQNETYPDWVSHCMSILKNIHNIEQRLNLPTITVVANNVGARPANNALCVFMSKGNFEILPPLTDEDIEEVTKLTRFPTPPEAPRGSWRSLADYLSGAFSVTPIEVPRFADADLFNNDFIAQRDPNTFYYKPERSMKPVDAYELECEQWRHNSDEQEFDVQIVVDNPSQQTRGVIEVQIHAENLTSPVIKTLPVRIGVKSINLEDRIQILISNM